MAPRNQVPDLQLLSLNQLVPLVQHLVSTKARLVVRQMQQDENQGCVYRKSEIETFAQEMKTFFLIIPPVLVEAVVDHILLGVKGAAAALQNSWSGKRCEIVFSPSQGRTKNPIAFRT